MPWRASLEDGGQQGRALCLCVTFYSEGLVKSGPRVCPWRPPYWAGRACRSGFWRVRVVGRVITHPPPQDPLEPLFLIGLAVAKGVSPMQSWSVWALATRPQ